MARQKSEDRVLPEGGVMPAECIEPSLGAQGKAVSVEQAAWQLRLPIATAEHSQGAARRASADRSADREVRVPKAIVNVENVTPVTMEEVVSRLTAALVKVVSDKGAPGPDGQTVDQLREQCSTAGQKLAAGCLTEATVRARSAERIFRRRAAACAGWESRTGSTG
jgi:hypothetical protein